MFGGARRNPLPDLPKRSEAERANQGEPTVTQAFQRINTKYVCFVRLWEKGPLASIAERAAGWGHPAAATVPSGVEGGGRGGASSGPGGLAERGRTAGSGR